MSRLGRTAWALVILLAACVAACASDEERFEERLARAEKYREEQRIKEAIIELSGALRLDPANALVNERLGDLSRESGDAKYALFFYREAQRLDPQRVEPLLAEFPLVLGDDPERAGDLVQAALELAPDDARVHQRRAELALVRADTAEALSAALTAVELAPDDPRSHHALGVVYQAKAREQRLAGEQASEELFRSALGAFERADRGDGALQAQIQKARTLASWPGHGEEAKAALQAALERAIELEDQPHQLLIAEEMVLRGRRSKNAVLERQGLEAITAIDPDELTQTERFALGDSEARIRRAWNDLANLAESESPGTGAAVLERQLEERPDDSQVHLSYARFISARGRHADALAHLEASADRGVEPSLLLDEAVRQALEYRRRRKAERLVKRLEAEQPGKPRTLLANARLALATGDSDAAAELLGRVNELEESAESQLLLAQAEFQLANLVAAERAVNRSLALWPRNPTALRLKAHIAFRRAAWNEVRRTLQRLQALTGARLPVEDRLLLIRPLYELGREKAGRALLDEILASDSPPQAAVTAFVRNEGSRDPEATARVLEEALAKRPASLPLLRMATGFDLRHGEIDRALGRLDRRLESRPDAPALLALRARAYARANRLDEAERDARRAFERNAAVPGLIELILSIYRSQGRVEVAIEQLEASARRDLLAPRQRVLLGRLHLRNGNADRAQELYESALAEDPGLAGAKNDLAFLLAREERNLDRALQLAREAQQELGDNPQVLDTLGYVMLRRGLAAPAAEQLGSALRMAEERGQASAYLHYHMGLALRALGREEQAAEYLARALSLEPEFADAPDARRQLEAARAATGTS